MLSDTATKKRVPSGENFSRRFFKSYSMQSASDLVLAIFYLQKNRFPREDLEALVENIRVQYPDASRSEIELAAIKAKKLAQLSSRSFYGAPTVGDAADQALKLFKQELPGLSDAAYSAALHQVMYSWMK